MIVDIIPWVAFYLPKKATEIQKWQGMWIRFKRMDKAVVMKLTEMTQQPLNS